MSNNEERAIEKEIRRKPNLAKKQDLLRIRPDFFPPLKKKRFGSNKNMPQRKSI